MLMWLSELMGALRVDRALALVAVIAADRLTITITIASSITDMSTAAITITKHDKQLVISAAMKTTITIASSDMHQVISAATTIASFL